MSSNRKVEEDIQEILTRLRQILAPDVSIGAHLRFEYKGGEGFTAIDGTKTPNEPHLRLEKVDCLVRLTLPDHLKIVSGELNQAEAFQTGRLFISGDIAAGARYSMIVNRALKGER